MALTPGLRLGVYEITAPLGEGGMGVVYRARDTKLNRDVALKVLPEQFVLDPERVARFRREAQVLASLDHPNIGAIYGFEDADGAHALVLQLVEGETLADRIGQGAIPLDEALPIARQIADALEAAHEKGIVHRDLKPANIKVTADGRVKVLDFGLAKLLESDSDGPTASLSSERGRALATNSPTITTPAMTMAGVILGTAAYMSPEQAKGRPADKRSDIWAFGCVLYEMLTGKRAFEGEDVAETLAFVLTREPDWAALQPNTPPPIRTVLVRCLRKDRKRRLPDIAVARLEFDEILATDEVPHGQAAAAAPADARSRSLSTWIAATAVVVALVVAAIALVWSRQSGARSPTFRLNAGLGADASLDVEQGPALTLSPDGTTVAFVASRREPGESELYVRRVDQLQATLLQGTAGAHNPFFSPDGQWVGFFANGKLRKVSVNGGSVIPLCDAPNGRGASWLGDTIVFLPVSTGGRQDIGGYLMSVPSAGGQPTQLTKLLPTELTQRWPQVLPGGKAVLYTVTSADRLGTGAYENADIVVQPLPPDGTRKIVHRGGYYGRYLRSGHLLYVHDGSVFVEPFDLRRLESTGAPVPAIDSVLSSGGQGSAHLAIADNGTLIYVPGRQESSAGLLSWIDRAGTLAPVRPVPFIWSNISFSPDGHRLALNSTSRDGLRFTSDRFSIPEERSSSR